MLAREVVQPAIDYLRARATTARDYMQALTHTATHRSPRRGGE